MGWGTLILTIIFYPMLPVSTEKLHKIYLSCNHTVCTDTRKIAEGSLFFCLRGGNFNGNLFADEALKKGAAYVVVDEKQVIKDERYLWVEDVLTSLQALSHYHRKYLPVKILGIGGSNGKTTTKELALCVINSFSKAKATAGNLNNHIGVPLTLLGFTDEINVGIVEMGTNHPGEMKVLCDLAEPDLGIVTNVGKEHLEGFKDLEGIAREESELYLNLIQHDGFALVNLDDPWLGNMSKRFKKSFGYGVEAGKADLKAVIHCSMPNLEIEFTYSGKNYGPYTASIGGIYNAYNMLAAIAAGISLGGDIETCIGAACAYVPANNRSEWKHTNNRSIWMDAYNANPSSMEAALRSFAEMGKEGAVLLGDMLELGDHAQTEHKAIFNLAVSLGFKELLVCGPEFKEAAGSYPLAFESTNTLLSWIENNPVSSKYVLMKGSRGMKMELLLPVLE
jgi:UDP-N-acetylmuramoyl-tripeptide--D-alanyl-D-alanine ligase